MEIYETAKRALVKLYADREITSRYGGNGFIEFNADACPEWVKASDLLVNAGIVVRKPDSVIHVGKPPRCRQPGEDYDEFSQKFLTKKRIARFELIPEISARDAYELTDSNFDLSCALDAARGQGVWGTGEIWRSSDRQSIRRPPAPWTAFARLQRTFRRLLLPMGDLKAVYPRSGLQVHAKAEPTVG